jgi:hypothetical protein
VEGRVVRLRRAGDERALHVQPILRQTLTAKHSSTASSAGSAPRSVGPSAQPRGVSEQRGIERRP